MRVLFTNNSLDGRGGTELYIRDVALALLKRGHNPVVYSTRLGAVAKDLFDATVPVVDDLSLLTAVPDIIHGQHHMDAMTAMMYFPDTPAVFFCHGWMPWEEMAPRYPSIRRYIAVDDLCLERLQCQQGIAQEQIRLIRNFVDLERFKLRDELPSTPSRALIFDNTIGEGAVLNVLREACAARGISLDVIGTMIGRSESHPENLLGRYDIVFAKARCALEALACGTAVIVCSSKGLGGMVRPDNYNELRALNFGVRTLRASINVKNIGTALDRYDAVKSRAVTLRARAEGNMEAAIDQILAVYQEALHTPAGEDSPLRAASNYFRQIAEFTKGRYAAERMRAEALQEAAMQRERADQATADARAQRLRAEQALKDSGIRTGK